MQPEMGIVTHAGMAVWRIKSREAAGQLSEEIDARVIAARG